MLLNKNTFILAKFLLIFSRVGVYLKICFANRPIHINLNCFGGFALAAVSLCVSHNLALWQHVLTNTAFFATSFSIFFWHALFIALPITEGKERKNNPIRFLWNNFTLDLKETCYCHFSCLSLLLLSFHVVLRRWEVYLFQYCLNCETRRSGMLPGMFQVTLMLNRTNNWSSVSWLSLEGQLYF